MPTCELCGFDFGVYAKSYHPISLPDMNETGMWKKGQRGEIRQIDMNVCGDCLSVVQSAMHACREDGKERRHAEAKAREREEAAKAKAWKPPVSSINEEKKEEKKSFLSRKKEKEE